MIFLQNNYYVVRVRNNGRISLKPNGKCRSDYIVGVFCVPVFLQSAGVMSVYLFMKRYSAEEMYQPRHPSFYRPRLSNCSDHSGQFLHPEAWSRGRSPSDISSEASLHMGTSYPALLKCPDYDQVSSSPC